MLKNGISFHHDAGEKTIAINMPSPTEPTQHMKKMATTKPSNKHS